MSQNLQNKKYRKKPYYSFLFKLSDKLNELEPKWQNTVILGVGIITIILVKLGLDTELTSVSTIGAISVMAGLVLSLALKFVITLLSRSSFLQEEHDTIEVNYQERKQMQELFEEAINISSGNLTIERTLSFPIGFKMASDSKLIQEISKINFEAFEHSRWNDAFDKKLERNKAFWKKNPNTFSILCQADSDSDDDTPNADQVYFFSNIIPLTQIGYERYFQQQTYGDNDFRPDWIAGQNEEAHSILIFTIARDLEKAKAFFGDRHSLLMSTYLRAVSAHISVLLARHFHKQSQVSVYFQNSRPEFERLAQKFGMEPTNQRSFDNEKCFVTTINKL
ncbi:hypothetical protein [Kordiimonas sp. SCSIO 12610]|uniref:hypothetical protein n=1 Tax=Kordiimonas sp. SCSIO 12610 TaxID=2829597 RepID=UPI002108FB55|nr:hypothetical protein [Kordiimonas sp. SCSIO 12610]UTW54086.1 hypothetical protein KFF44_09590 [Kordiimonas sp. SCSIO 12610]